MMGNNIQWGVLGCSRHALSKAIPAIQSSCNGSVLSIASRDINTAQHFAQQMNIPKAVGSYDAVLADPEIDAVYIPLPNHLHAVWSIRSAIAGKHVLCEKPAALTLSEFRDVAETCKEARVLFMEGFMYRFHPLFKNLRELLTNGAIGNLRMVRNSLSYSLESRHSPTKTVYAAGGGALYDIGCYCVDLCCWLYGGKPQRQFLWKDRMGLGNVDYADVGVLEFSRQCVGLFDISFSWARRNRCELVGTRGVIEVASPFSTETPASVMIETPAGRDLNEYAPVNTLKLQFEHFSSCIQNNEEPAISCEESARNIAVLDGLRAFTV